MVAALAYTDPSSASSQTKSASLGGTGSDEIVLDVPRFAQAFCDAGFQIPATKLLGDSKVIVMKDQGCALTSYFMGSHFNPVSLPPDVCAFNDALKKPANGFKQFNALEDLKASLKQGYPVIVKVKIPNPNRPNGFHYVIVYGWKDGEFLIRDPATKNNKLLSDIPYTNNFQSRGQIRPAASIADAITSLSISISDGAEGFVQDSQGRRVGIDPKTLTEYREIPDSVYFQDETTSLEDDNAPQYSTREIIIPRTSIDRLEITLFGTSTKPISVVMSTVSDSGVVGPRLESNLRIEQGKTIQFFLTDSITPPEPVLGKKFIRIDQFTKTFKPTDYVSGIIWTQVYPSNPDYKVSIVAEIDGASLPLDSWGDHMHGYAIPPLPPGIHEIRVRAYLHNRGEKNPGNGLLFDEVVTYISVEAAKKGKK